MAYQSLKISMAILSFLSTFPAFANSQCITPEKNEYLALKASVVFEQIAVKKKLLDNYCFEFEKFYTNKKDFPGMFFSQNQEDIEIFTTRSMPINFTNSMWDSIDLLSYKLLFPNVNIKNDEIKEVFNLLKNYDPNINLNSLQIKNTNYANYEQLLNFIVKNYNQHHFFPITKTNNNPLTFSIIGNQYNVLNELLNYGMNNRKIFLYKKNNNGITPFHFAFAKKHNFKQPAYETNLKAINDLLILNLEQNKLKYLNIKNIDFFEFIELFKENNIDLYSKINIKFPHSKLPVEKLNIAFKKPIETELNFADNIIF